MKRHSVPIRKTLGIPAQQSENQRAAGQIRDGVAGLEHLWETSVSQVI